MGGRAKPAARLDRFFTELSAGPRRPYAYPGNEPNLGAPWLYDWLGRPNALLNFELSATSGSRWVTAARAAPPSYGPR